MQCNYNNLYDAAPIILFVYNRPIHTRMLLKSLAGNPLAQQSVLFIYADGPKADASGETLQKIQEVRSVIREKTGVARFAALNPHQSGAS